MTQAMREILELPAVLAAPAILGWVIGIDTPEGRIAGRIVETEAYNQDDEASHSFRGLTPRTAPMFERAGTIYVYFTYGMHHCVNVVTGPVGRAEAVLIRALEPVEGISLMYLHRGFTVASDEKAAAKQRLQLTNGPGKLAQALSLTVKHSGSHIDTGPLFLKQEPFGGQITQTVRVGIRHAVDELWRFYVTGNPYVSRK
jgi:DNA-3-methyladenine glycosylase